MEFDPSTVTVGSEWRADNGMRAKVVALTVSEGGRGPLLCAEVVYDSGDGRGYAPSILPSRWLVKDWPRKFRPLTPTNDERAPTG